MQSIMGYRFLLKAPDNYPESGYQETKASIEKLCLATQKSCKNAKIEKMNFAIYVKEDMFISVSYRNEMVEFALFDSSTKKLIQECSIYDFQKYISKARLDALENRIENECQAIGRGHILQRDNLDHAWEEKFTKQQCASEQTNSITESASVNERLFSVRKHR